ncbi:MAG: phosphoribosylanthranilate isomerase [Thermodesulfobacteriota bacterium]
MIIQVYEIQHPKEAVQVMELGVTHVGTVLQSPSDIADPVIRETIAEVQRSGRQSSVIPLFTDESDICRAVETLGFDILHLCDELLNPNGAPVDPYPWAELQRRIRHRYPSLRITRTIPVPVVGTGESVRRIVQLAQTFQDASDLLLIDTWIPPALGRQPVLGYVGITGKPCDWTLSREIVRSVDIPVILAGGLGPDNVAEAIRQVHPAGVDSCTRTNAFDAFGKPLRFVKDMAKVEAFVQHAKRAFALLPKGD